MSEYTAEDFAQATFARHENGRKAIRIGSDRGIFRWWVGKYGGATDEDMAAEGWTPVVEVEDWKQRIAALSTAHDEVKNLLKDTADDLRHDLALAREELVNLREENGRLERILQAPLSLKDLEVAWDAAEVPTDDDPIREGDVCLVLLGATWIAGEVGDRWWPVGDARILSRAPQREPWQDLADVLSEWFGSNQTSNISMEQFLHERGVRVTGGEG